MAEMYADDKRMCSHVMEQNLGNAGKPESFWVTLETGECLKLKSDTAGDIMLKLEGATDKSNYPLLEMVYRTPMDTARYTAPCAGVFRECDHSLSDAVDESPQAYGWSDGCLQIATGVVCTEVNLTSNVNDKKGWIYMYGLVHESGVAKLTCHEGNVETVQETNLQEGPNGVGLCDTSGGQLHFECTYKATRPYNRAKLVAWAGDKYWHAVRTDARASTIFDVGYYTDKTGKMKEAHKSVIWGKNTANGRRYSVRHLNDEDLSVLWNFEAVDADIVYTKDKTSGVRLNDIKSDVVAYCRVDVDHKSSGELFQKKCAWKESMASDNGTHLVATAAEDCSGNAISASCITKPRWFSLKENERVEIQYHCLAGSGRIFLGGMEVSIVES